MIIHQRSSSQCAIAAVVMATNMPYDVVLKVALDLAVFEEGKGTSNISKLIETLGGYKAEYDNGENVGSLMCMHRPYTIAPEYFRTMAWGRRAVMTVPSLNNPEGNHCIYWTGRKVHDPNPMDKKRYTKFSQLLPSEIILFNDIG